MAKNNNAQPATKGDLACAVADLKTELKADIKNLSGEILKINFRVDRIDETINTKVAMKDDLNRLFNLLDSVAGDIKGYQRQDTLRGDAVMRHDKSIADHETRISTLETKH